MIQTTTHSNRDRYRRICEDEKTIPFFTQAFWLDTVCGEDEWDVALVEKGGHVMAALPYLQKQKYGMKILTQPRLTQTLGPWLRPSEGKYAKQLARQKDLMSALIEALPDYVMFSQNFHHSIKNWQPFFWRGFSQTTAYTYRLEDLSDQDELWGGFQNKIRTDIRKAETRHGISVDCNGAVDDLIALNEKTFARQDRQRPYDDQLLRDIVNTCGEQHCGRIFIASDKSGCPHAGALIVWDKQSAYYLIGGGDPELRNSGATSLCLWEAIKFSATVSKSFDFEGSMIEPIERFFRGFGAVQTPYFKVTHTPSRLLRLRKTFQEILKC